MLTSVGIPSCFFLIAQHLDYLGAFTLGEAYYNSVTYAQWSTNMQLKRERLAISPDEEKKKKPERILSDQ